MKKSITNYLLAVIVLYICLWLCETLFTEKHVTAAGRVRQPYARVGFIPQPGTKNLAADLYERRSTVWKPSQSSLFDCIMSLRNLKKPAKNHECNPMFPGCDYGSNFDEDPDPDLDPACYFDADSVTLMWVRIRIRILPFTVECGSGSGFQLLNKGSQP